MPLERPAAWDGGDALDPRREAEAWRRRAEAAIVAERQVADRFARLHATTAALSAAVSPGEVAAVIAGRGWALPGASGCAVALVDAVGALRLAAVRASGRPAGSPELTGHGADAPLTTAVRERVAVWSIGPDARARAAACGLEHATALVALPLVAQHVLGAVALSFDAVHDVDEEEQAFLEAFAYQCGQALERARLYQAERAARLEAQRAADAVRRAMEMQERLVGIVGHDLRTPLAAIRMATGLLFRRGGLSEEQARTLARLGASAARMTAIIRDLMDFTRVRKGGTLPVEPRAIDLAELVRHAAAELQAVHPDREIVLEVPAAAPAIGDPERLVQVLSNLVGNAVQHGPLRAPVRVAVRTRDDGVAVSVHNEGPPIPPDLLPEIFEPFRQGVRPSDASGSVGLGLFIVRELVRAHGGIVEVESSAAAGTTFTVRLLAAPDPTGRPSNDR
jgi:signal transduction histidine kinase